MNVFAKFDEIPLIILQNIQGNKTLRTHGRSVGLSVVRMDNVQTVYPPTNTVCGGIIKALISCTFSMPLICPIVFAYAKSGFYKMQKWST